MLLETTILCLALNIFHEARAEPEAGRIEVALVTINRSEESGKNVCDVIKEPGQFSWYIPGQKLKAPLRELAAWRQSLIDAQIAYYKLRHIDERNSLYFHIKGRNPVWRKYKKPTITIGNHVFYTDKG